MVSTAKLLAVAALPSSPRFVAAQQASAGPGTRAGHVLAWHAGLERICLLGGDRPASMVQREEPWFFDGREWTTRQVERPPIAATLAAIAADPERKSVLMFGGLVVQGPRSYGPASSELWQLGADATWRKLIADGPWPTPRHHLAATFDTGRGRLVVYGGVDGLDKWSREIWEWDRERWHRFEPAVNPGERVHHALAYDSKRGRVVLRGGFGSDNVRQTDTWEWDGKEWRRAATDGPNPGGGYRLAYDEERGVTVLFGGLTSVWDGKSWTRLETPRAPAARVVHGMAYDPRRKRTVVYGGSVDKRDAADTWEWDGAEWREITPK